jgi:putative phage-type endonuclease
MMRVLSPAAVQEFDWHEWRRQGLGSSDAPALMGESPWKTPYDVWEDKTGRAKPRAANYAQQRGIDREPEARAKYELESDIDMPPMLVESAAYPFLRASLDGFNADARRVLEIKCPGREDHAEALAGRVPKKYQWQLVHQLMVTEAEEAHYWSYYEKKGVLVVFKRDLEREAILKKASIDFWADFVLTDTPPPLSDRDYRDVTEKESSIFVSALRQYRHYKAEADRIALVLEGLKEAAEAQAKLLGHTRLRADGITFVQCSRKGNVDYAKIPELRGVDLEKYRKKPSVYWQVK